MRPVIIDYDIGFDWDDVVTHLLATRSPDVDIVLILTNDEFGGRRAQLARLLLQVAGLDIPVAAGTDLGNTNFVAESLLAPGLEPVDEDWRGALLRCLAQHDRVDYLGLGAMTNIATFLREHPAESRGLRLLQMGGAVCRVHRRGSVEHNVALDPTAFRTVLRSGMPARFVLGHTTNRKEIEVNPGSPLLERLRASGRPEDVLAASCFDLWFAARGHGSYMHDPLTCTALIDPRMVQFTTARFLVDTTGCLHLPPDGREDAARRLLPALDADHPIRDYLLIDMAETPSGDPVDLHFSCRADYAGFLQLLEQRLFE